MDEQMEDAIFDALEDAVEVETSGFQLGALVTRSPEVFVTRLRELGYEVAQIDELQGDA